MTFRVASLRTARGVPARLIAAFVLATCVVLVARPGRPAAPTTQAAPPSAITGPSSDASIDRATPRRTFRSFLAAARDGDFETASHCLDLRGLAGDSSGPDLAEELSYVLYRRPPIALDTLSDEPSVEGGRVVVTTFTVGEQEVPLVLARVKSPDGVERWLVSRATVRRIPDIAATVPASAWVQRLPRALRQPVVLGNAPWQWLGVVASFFLALLIGRLGAAVATRIGGRFAKGKLPFVDDLLVDSSRRPLRTIIASVAFGVLVYALQVSLTVAKAIGHVAYSGFVLGFAWLLLAGFGMIARLITPARALSDDVVPDSAGERTRRALLQRVASAGIVGVTVALLLLQFDVVRHVGLSLLASAGIAGVVLGLAAQKSLSGLIAGIQLSITQPVRLGDVIFLDGESGTVQDIFLTYAVVRYWDDRCVVVPLSRFIDTPFQNWTLLRHDLYGVIQLHVKFTAPIERLRAKAREICEAHAKWDKKRCDVQVGDSDMYGMVLRVMVSARSPADAWDLRCSVREGLITFLTGIDGGTHLG